ncbi:MAG: glutathione S-transferase family protein [Woeseiaceae bacterium]|nr:glutathione S-transferase family protein [Woeseiaceae bacterium]
MKFYDCKTAPSPRRVRIFLAEKGIDIETIQVDLASGEQFSDEFRQMNPDCVVPVLQLDDGSCLSEVTAICQYLEACYPEPPLLGTTVEERARVTMWNTKIEQQGLLSMADAFRNSAKGLSGRAVTGSRGYEQIPELAERGRQRVQQFFARLDGQLADSTYIAGANFSMADISALVVVDFAAWIKIGVPDKAANLARWYGEISARPGAVA